MPPRGEKLSCIALTDPLETIVVISPHSALAGMPNRTSLPSMEPWPPVMPLNPYSAKRMAIRPMAKSVVFAAKMALPCRLSFTIRPIRERDGRRDEQDGDHLEEVAEGGRVLEGMGRVHAEESAAVAPQLLDGDLGRCRSQWKDLVLAFEADGELVRAEVLDHPL